MKIYYGLFSECGPHRKNEDYIAVREMPGQGRSVFVLCDGMGGHELGEVASRFVAEHVCDYWTKNPDMPDSENKILEACMETKIAFDKEAGVEMGTTMAMAAIEGNKALLAHCGDSRIYVVRESEIIYQSTDHLALTPEGWPIITRAFFTGRANYNPDITEFEVRVGDMILICSDGVYGNGKWHALNETLLDEHRAYPLWGVEDVAKNHVHDNYSAMLIRICEDQPCNHSEPGLFKLRRRPKGSDADFKYFEFFRTRKEACARLIELGHYGPEKDKYQYGISRITN